MELEPTQSRSPSPEIVAILTPEGFKVPLDAIFHMGQKGEQCLLFRTKGDTGAQEPRTPLFQNAPDPEGIHHSSPATPPKNPTTWIDPAPTAFADPTKGTWTSPGPSTQLPDTVPDNWEDLDEILEQAEQEDADIEMRQTNAPSSLKTALKTSIRQTQNSPSLPTNEQANSQLLMEMVIDNQDQLSATTEAVPTAPPSSIQPKPIEPRSNTKDSTPARKGTRCPAQTSILAYMPPFLTNLGPPSTGAEKKNE